MWVNNYGIDNSRKHNRTSGNKKICLNKVLENNGQK